MGVKWGKLFRDMGYAAITMINVGALAAVVLGILLLLTVCGCLIHSKGAGCILNIIFASLLVGMLTLGCIVMTVNYQWFVTRGKGEWKFALLPNVIRQVLMSTLDSHPDVDYWRFDDENYNYA